MQGMGAVSAWRLVRMVAEMHISATMRTSRHLWYTMRCSSLATWIK